MTTSSPVPAERRPFTAPVIDYEPAPVRDQDAALCPAPSPAALRRPTPRPWRPARVPPADPPPRAAVLFADVALRRILEVVDRRRPLTQLRPVLAPSLFDTVGALTRVRHAHAATVRRVGLRGDGAAAAEVYATYHRGGRVRAIAARIELGGDGRWRVVALQIG
ncbi:Rv3235 family protein [Mycobacterium sp. PS03-16]|uniref:Rv3235 family protein n=1 Tax=Mycobacterium sp. PS03-16 TaxID=2559611 RepID=UPI001FD72708|nr:Rv3235 family protein [Mycobacterium sp. PS03-16]